MADTMDTPSHHNEPDVSHGTNQHADSSEHGPLVQVAETQYQEAVETHFVPTKTGEPEVICETQLEEERPHTRGSTHSAHTDFEETEDGVILAAFTVVRKEESAAADNDDELVGDVGSFITRPRPAETPVAEIGFSFTKATRQHMDFTGTRKGPAACSAVDATDSMIDVARPAPVSIGVHDVGVGGLVQPLDATSNGAQEETDAPKPDRKRKKKKSLRNKTVLINEDDEDSRIDTAIAPVVVPDHAMRASADYVSETPDLRHGPPAVQDGTRSGPLDLACGAAGQCASPESSARQPARMQDHTQARKSSPHSQLQNDLQAAAVVQGRENVMFDVRPEIEPPEVEPLSPVQHDRVRTPPPEDSHAGRRPGDASQHIDTGRPSPPRTNKKRSKGGRRARATATAETAQAEQSSSNVNDYLQIVAHKFQEQDRMARARFTAERESLQAELQQSFDAVQAIQAEYDAVQQQKAGVESALQQQRSKVIAYEAKIGKFKTFVDGLGNDLNALKKESSATRRRSEQLVQEGDERKHEQNALCEQLSSCAERASHLKDEALKTCREAHSELQAATLRCAYLEKELGDKAGLLSEERDRRCQLERQLEVQLERQSVSAPVADESIKRLVESTSNAVLDKLYEIHAVVEANEQDHTTSEMIKQTCAAVQALDTQHSSNADDIGSLRNQLDELSHR